MKLSVYVTLPDYQRIKGSIVEDKDITGKLNNFCVSAFTIQRLLGSYLPQIHGRGKRGDAGTNWLITNNI